MKVSGVATSGSDVTVQPPAVCIVDAMMIARGVALCAMVTNIATIKAQSANLGGETSGETNWMETSTRGVPNLVSRMLGEQESFANAGKGFMFPR